MQYIQITAFILNIIFFVILGFVILLYIFTMWSNRHRTKLSNRKLIISTIISLIGFSLILVFSIPNIKDLSPLIKGDHKTIEGIVDIQFMRGTLSQKVSVAGVDTYFFIDSGAEDSKKYIVSYLPHSETGINIATYDGTPLRVKSISIIFMVFYVLLYIVAIYAFVFKRDFFG